MEKMIENYMPTGIRELGSLTIREKRLCALRSLLGRPIFRESQIKGVSRRTLSWDPWELWCLLGVYFGRIRKFQDLPFDALRQKQRRKVLNRLPEPSRGKERASWGSANSASIASAMLELFPAAFY